MTAETSRRLWIPIGVAVVVTALAAGTWIVVAALGSPGCVDVTTPRSYAIDPLSRDFQPRAISPNGEYVAGLTDGYTRDRPVLWHDGEYTDVATPRSAPENLNPTGVNDSGVVVGEYVEDDFVQRYPWRFQDGDFTSLLDPRGDRERGGVDGVAADGTAVGRFAIDDTGFALALWPEAEASATRLPLPEPDGHVGGKPTDISAEGVVVSTTGGRLRVWDGEGEGRELAKLPESVEPVITGDWVLADGRRWNLAEDREYSDFGTARLGAIDACGRGYGVDDERDGRPIVHDGKVRRLPERDEGGFERDEPENPYGRVYAASADGAVLVGESMGRPVLWRYE